MYEFFLMKRQDPCCTKQPVRWFGEGLKAWEKELMRRMDILQTLAIFTLLAAPTLFDFLVAILGDTDKKDRAL